MEPSIRAQRLTKRYGPDVVAFQELEFEIGQGEFVVFVGKSGCGKTSLLRVIAGLSPPSNGQLTFRGQPIYGADRPARGRFPGRLGFVFQEANLLPWRTIAANICLPLESLRVPAAERRERMRDLAGSVGISDFIDFYPTQLSGGMRQRAALARALIGSPDLLLMDEPFGALDALTRESMNALLEQVWMLKRATVMLVTHSISEAALLADRIFVLSPHPGRLKRIYPVPAGRPRGREFLSSPEIRDLMASIKQDLGE